MPKLLALIVAALIAGCATALEQQIRAVEHQPPAFRDGYRDGCESGLSAGGAGMQYKFSKSVQRYDSDGLYTGGWDAGLQICRTWALLNQ